MKDSTQQLPKFGLSLLGRFELSAGDGVVHLPSRKLAGLLAYLACTAPQPQPREKLAHLLWGSHFETQARQNLRQAIFRLRRILGQEALVNSDDEVWLAPGAIDCDVVRFRALIAEGGSASLAAAADLYRHPLLTDLNIAEDAWSDWRNLERERLEDMALDAIVGHSRQAMAAGNAETALKAANRAVAVNDLREDAHRLIIQALVAMGRRAEALKHYGDLVALLRRELGAEPDAVTQSLVAELRGARPQEISQAPAERLNQSHAASGQETETASAAMPSGGASSMAPVPVHRLEQRQLTIMVCNLAGPMPLSQNLDPEDVHDLIAAFHKIAADVAARFEGFVAQYQGYGVLVYFGYPAAHEHDAERAVRAGLAIIDALDALNASSVEKVEASVGIATGLVVVGEKSATGNSHHHVATGETPDLATRLQAGAAPGEVVIAAGTQRIVGRMFDCHALPAIDVRHRPQPAEAWRVHGETAGMSRFEARRGDALSPLVGRQEEIDLLLRRWEQARSGEGRVVLVSGEPGIGKSHIAESLRNGLGGEPHACFRYFCSPHHAQSPLHPFMTQIEQDAGFQPGDGTSAQLDRLEALLKPTSVALPRDVALFAEMLGMPLDGRYPALTASPQQKREMILDAIHDRLNGAASQKPVLIVFEDVHWIDPTSQDLLERMVGSATRLPLLLLVTCRPEFQPGWIGQPHVTTLSLNRLGPSDGAGIVRSVARERALPDATVEQILSRTDGVPLFIEELTRALLESGLLDKATDSCLPEGPLPIPTSLQAALVARLDLLGPAKDVAMIGAAIGREFSHELIAAVSALAPVELEAALARLVGSGLVSRRGAPPELSYIFKHALVQDAAYVTMLRSRRRQVHADIAGTLARRFPSLAEKQPEIVARHFTEAGLASEAVGYWVKGARLAQARWAHREAAGFFEQALRVLATLPETREALEQAIDLRFDLKASLIPLGQFERIVSYLREAEILAIRIDDRHRLAQFSFHMCQTLVMSGDPAEAFAFGQQALTAADSLGDIGLQVAATLFLGTASFSTLDYRQVEPLFVRALQLLDGEPTFERFGLAGYPAVTVRAFLARIYAEQGKFEQGIAHGEEGIHIAHAVDDPYSLTIAYWCLADLHVIRGEPAEAIILLEHVTAVARARDLPFMSAGISGTLGHAHTLLGRSAQGLALLEQALAAFETMDHRFGQALFLVPLGEAYMLAGRYGDAAIYAARALAVARESGQRRGEASALHLLGEVSMRTEPMEHAEAHYRNALEIATELGLPTIAARCHHGLGKLYLRGGLPDQARDQLDTAATMYREMGMRFQTETQVAGAWHHAADKRL